MMQTISKENLEKIHKIWDDYKDSGFRTQDLKGNDHDSASFDQMRLEAIKAIQIYINDFLANRCDMKTFKGNIDSYNKRNNLWGFAAVKGQMFFNQLWNASQKNSEGKITEVLRQCIRFPKDLAEALDKISHLEKYVRAVGETVEDKRKSPNPGSVAYFLSYFWQIMDFTEYPIMYTSLITSINRLGLWKKFETQAECYEYFYHLMTQIRDELRRYTGKQLTHWDVEHSFWLREISSELSSTASLPLSKEVAVKSTRHVELEHRSSLHEYLPPIVADLVMVGQQEGPARKGLLFEKKIAMLMRMLDFDVEELGQGKGREPDGIARYRQENIAFIYDAKVREGGFSVGVSDRAIREYINDHYPRLERDGYKKIGFIIVSSHFRGEPDEIIDDLTLQTPIKRVALVKSEALLQLLAYKLKDGVATAEIAKLLLQNGVITESDIDEKLSDV